MRDFQGPGRLRKLSFHGRLVYTIFIAFTLAGFAITAWLTSDMVGLDLAGNAEYYAGIQPEAAAEAPPDEEALGGPMLDLPDELGGPPEPTPMSDRKLLEVTHFHLFTMPVYLLILSHLFMLSRLRSRTKTFWIVAGAAGTAAHMAAPWVAVANPPGATAFYAVSGLLLALTFLVMCLVPLREMWSNGPSKTAS